MATRSRTATERLLNREAPRKSGGGCAGQEIQNKRVVRRLLGKNLRFVQRVQFAVVVKQAGGVGGGRRDEAAAKNEEYEGFDKENQIKRIELTLGADGGLWSCWRQIARKRGFILGGKTPHKSGVSG